MRIRLVTTLALLGALIGGVVFEARAYTNCTTDCYGSGAYRTCTRTCY